MGHIDYLKQSKQHGDYLFIIVNSDYQVKLKGSKIFMDEGERLEIIKNIKCVDDAMVAIDNSKCVIDSIKYLYTKYKMYYNFIFTNGGDQFFFDSPESDICKQLKIKTIDGLGQKIQSSSWLLNKNK